MTISYLAYGSNMDPAAMAIRCPGAHPIGPARLAGHAFFIAARGYASLRRNPSQQVFGVLWRLTPANLAALDRYEEVPEGLYDRDVRPVQGLQGLTSAILYIARDAAPGQPLLAYQAGIVSAARFWGFPDDYVRQLELWLPAS